MVEDRAGDVAHLRFRGHRVVDHRVQDLGGDDHRPSRPATLRQDPFLGQGYALEARLGGEIPPVDHKDVRLLDYLAQVVQCPLSLYLGDDLWAPAADQLADHPDVIGGLHEAQPYEVDLAFRRKPYEFAVARREDLGGEPQARDVDPFGVRQHAAVLGPADNVLADDLGHSEAQAAVVDPNRVPDADVGG